MSAFNNKKVGIISAVELKKGKYKLLYWIIFAILMLFVLIAVVPSVWILLSGFKTVKEIYSVPPTLFPKQFDFGKLWDVWEKLELGRNYLNSLFIILGDVVFSIVFNSLGGYVLSRLRPKGSALVFRVIVWTMMLPAAGRTVPLYMEFVDFPIFHFNMLNTYWPLWLKAGCHCFYILLFKNFFDGISISLVEAARMDGATDIGIMAKIIFPLSVPVITYVGISQAQAAWGGFFWPNLVLDKKELVPMATRIYRMKTESYSMDEYFLALIFSIVPSALIFICFQKNIMGGVNIGGVKG